LVLKTKADTCIAAWIREWAQVEVAAMVQTKILPIIGALFVSSVVLASCLQVRDDGAVAEDDGCDFCHPALGGAHAVHVDAAGPYAYRMGCLECHPVPADWFVDGHLDAVVGVRFRPGGLATTGGLEPGWDGASCDQVYCHGATYPGAQYPQPVWTESFPGGLSCHSCHGSPPQSPHPASVECEECHGAAYTESDQLDPAVHVNGEVEFEDEDEDGDDGVGP
jgi:predicted CxxxxCH...CXXCH cytochrome family protein